MTTDDKFKQQLLNAIEDLGEAILHDAKVPEVTLNVPEAPAPVVNVAPAEVTVEAAKVSVPPARKTVCIVEVTERDPQNFIKKLKITPS